RERESSVEVKPQAPRPPDELPPQGPAANQQPCFRFCRFAIIVAGVPYPPVLLNPPVSEVRLQLVRRYRAPISRRPGRQRYIAEAEEEHFPIAEPGLHAQPAVDGRVQSLLGEGRW